MASDSLQSEENPRACGQTLTAHAIAALACRILALWLFARTVANLSMIVMMFGSIAIGRPQGPVANQVLISLVFAIADPLASVLVGVFLWRKAERIAAHMVDAASPAAVSGGLAAQDLLAIAFAAVGVYLLAAHALPRLALALATVILLDHAGLAIGHREEFNRLWVPLVQLVLGVWLFFGSRRIAKFGWREATSPERPPE